MLKIIATSIVTGKVGYALPVWGNLTQAWQTKLQSSLLSAARACLGPAHTRDSTDKLLRLMGWDGFPKMVEKAQSKIIHQVLTTGIPEVLYCTLPTAAAGHTRASQSANLRLPNRRSLRSKKLLSYSGVEKYNQLSKSFKQSGTSNIFKKNIKIFLNITRSNLVRNYNLNLINPAPDKPVAPSDIIFIPQPNGSLQRSLIPLRQYLGKQMPHSNPLQ